MDTETIKLVFNARNDLAGREVEFIEHLFTNHLDVAVAMFKEFTNPDFGFKIVHIDGVNHRLNEEQFNRVRSHVLAGRKVDAIRQMREYCKTSLKGAKDAVESDFFYKEWREWSYD